MDGLAWVGLGLLVLLLAPAVHFDLAQRRIPNLCNLALGAGGVALHVAADPGLAALGRGLLAAVLTGALFVGLLYVMRGLKARGQLGLGDVKFLIAAALWVGFSGAAWVFVIASLGLLAWTLALAPWRGLDLSRHQPFAPALACALLLVFTLTTAPSLSLASSS